MNLIGVFGTLVTLGCFPSVSAATSTDQKVSPPLWPGFRGVGGNGHAVSASPPARWNGKGGENVLWKTAIARHGMSSPVIAGNRLFVTAADHRVRQVLCYDTDTGNLFWNHDVSSVYEEDLPFVLEETGYAAPTAVTNGELVVAVFATGELICLDSHGNPVWNKQLGVPDNHYGHASSLISYEDLVIVQYDQNRDSKLSALNFATGESAWQVERPSISWSSPIVVNNYDRMEAIFTDSKYVTSYEPKTGKRFWRIECLAGEVASSAAYADGIVFVASEGAAATAIDIRKHDEDPRILWQWDKSLPDAASLLATKDYLIVPTAFGVVTCLDSKSGHVHWEHRFGKGFSSSPVLVDDRVYLTDMTGTTQIFKMSKEFELIGTSPLGEGVYATPAFVGDRIFVRGLTHLFCISDYRESDTLGNQ